MIHRIFLFLSLIASLVTSTQAAFTQPNPRAFPDLFAWSDTCNTYLLRSGDSAVLINLGDGSLLDHLAEIGVQRIDWVLFTDHHREQCQGAPRLRPLNVKIAAPEGEQSLFERPTHFRRMKVRLNDPFTIHGASYVRPPIQPILIDKPLKPGDTFHWNNLDIACIATPGVSPAGMTYQLQLSGQKLAFSGDVMLDGAVMHTWYDTEWDYGFAAGVHALQKTVDALIASPPDLMLPAHGPVIANPQAQLKQYAQKLDHFEKLYVRGYGVEAKSNAYQDKVSKPTPIKDLNQISPHLFKFKRINFWPNFNLILAANGHALLVDCGLLDPRFLDDTLDLMRKRYGLKAIDAVIITHMHGDHFLQAPHLREKWGTQIWALDNMIEKMEHPERFDYSALVQAYGIGVDGAKIDRVLKPGEVIDWEGYRFTIDWMPGQTQFALCVSGRIDGRLVAFTGDNIFGDPDDPAQTGHEAMVAHNSAILEEGYIQGAEFLSRLHPDILVGGHSFVMDHPAAFIERYRKWSYQMRDAFQSLSPDPDYRYFFDPYWLRAYPYRTTLKPGETAPITLNLRNFRKAPQQHRIEIHAPPGLTVQPALIQGQLPPESRSAFAVKVTAAPGLSPGTHIIALDVTLDGHRYGERFDFLIGLGEPGAPAQESP